MGMLKSIFRMAVVPSTRVLEEGLPATKSRLISVEARISEVDGWLHELLAYKSRLERAIKMLQAIELEEKDG